MGMSAVRAMQRRAARRRPNALKHGAFSTNAILPGEDPEEFHALLQSLIDEWRPAGRLEEETVRALAESLWRRSRLNAFAHLQRETEEVDHGRLGVNDLIRQAKKYAGRPEEFRKVIMDTLANPVLREEFWRRKTHLEWGILSLSPLLAGTELWDSLLIVQEVVQAGDLAFETFCDAFGVSEEKRKAWKEASQAPAKVVTLEDFEKELALRERLDGAIDRCLRRLLQLKAGKRMVGLDSQTKTLPQPRAVGRIKPRAVS